MTEQEKIKNLEEKIEFCDFQLKNSLLLPEEVVVYTDAKNRYQAELENLKSMTPAEKVGETIGKVGLGVPVSVVVGELKAALTGQTDEGSVQKTRAKCIAAGGTIGKKIFGFVERITKKRKG